MKNLIWMAIADKTRRKIITLLKNKALNAGEISEHFSLKKPTISHHLSVLKESGIVDCKKDKNNIIYYINKPVMDELVKAFMFMTLKKGV